MRPDQVSKLGAYFRALMVYLTLGFMSALLAFGLSSPFRQPFMGIVRVIVFVSGLLSIEVLVIREGPEGS